MLSDTSFLETPAKSSRRVEGSMDVVGLGFTSLDDLGIVPRLPTLDEGTCVHNMTRQGGGPVAQALVALTRLGAMAGFIGRVGDDEAGHVMRQGLEKEGVDTSRMQVTVGAASAQCIILVHEPTGKRSICTFVGTAGDVAAASVDFAYVCSGRFLHLDGHSLDAAICSAHAARAAGVTVCLDASGSMARLRELIPLTDILITGELFAQEIDGGMDIDRRMRCLLEMGPELVVVTRGEQGSITMSREQRFATPAFEVPVVDTTGAGDVFHGAYLFGLLHDWRLEFVAEFAAAAAALKCGKLGGRAGIPNLESVTQFLAARGTQSHKVGG